MKFVGISGFARSGKDTFAKSLVNFTKRDSVIIPLALSLKKEVDDFLIIQTQISAFTENNYEKDLIRPFLVFWGTNFRRSQDKDYWIKKLKNLAENFNDDVNVIIPDVRYENECDFIQESNGIVIGIDMEGAKPACENEKSETFRVVHKRSDVLLRRKRLPLSKLVEINSNDSRSLVKRFNL